VLKNRELAQWDVCDMHAHCLRSTSMCWTAIQGIQSKGHNVQDALGVTRFWPIVDAKEGTGTN